MVQTTTSMTAVSVSMRKAHSTLRSPETIHGKMLTRASWCATPTSANANHDSNMDANRNTVVTSSAGSEPAAGGSGECSSAGDGAIAGYGPSEGAARAWLSGPWA